MDDRELLERAARANWAREVADDEIGLRYSDLDEGILYLHADNQDHNGHDREFVWNPLIDDGDAMRLCVKLGLDLLRTDRDIEAIAGLPPYAPMERNVPAPSAIELLGDDPAAATRRAIVRAAASMAEDAPVGAGEG